MDIPEKRIAETIRIERLRLHLTQKQLADRAGTRQQTVSRIETGRRGATAVDLIKLARGLKKSVDDIAKDAGV
jgi:transcriptional regulator with XRE-family HTH domain